MTSRRDVFANAADSDEAAGLRAELREHPGRRHRLHARDARAGAEATSSATSPARCSTRRFSATSNGLLGALDDRQPRRRHELAGRRLRSGDARGVRAGVERGRRLALARDTAAAGFSDIRYVRGVSGQPFVEVFGPGDCCAADSPRAIAQAAAAAEAPARLHRTAAPAPGGAAQPAAAGGLTVQGLPIRQATVRRACRRLHLDRGELLWQVPHGDTPDGVRNHPALKGLNIPKTGQNGSVGLLVTKTLVDHGRSAGHDHPARPRARCCAPTTRRPAREVGAVLIPAPQSGSPMTYSVDGRQYIVVAVSGGNYSGEYIAFGLPN